MVKVESRSKIPVLYAEPFRLQHKSGFENAIKYIISALLARTIGDATVLNQPTYHGSGKL